MIAKKYRLSENEIRKVFARKKPFFSYMLVANVAKNNLPYSRVAIFLSSKVTKWSVNRNSFRRIFYNNSTIINTPWYDIVILPKKWTILSHKNPEDIKNFIWNLSFIYQKILSK